jgi:peptidoglycan/LPS O-acetylase OafA/YrhL
LPPPDERTRPRTGRLIGAVGGALLLVALFLPWYSRDTDIAGAVITQTWTAWQALPVIATALFLIAVAAVALPAAPPRFRSDRALVILGVASFLLVLFRGIDLPLPDIDLVEGDHADTSRRIGLFLALLATAAIAVGGRRDARTGPR